MAVSRVRFDGFPPEAFRFLRALGRNNRREWFLERKDVYLTHVRHPMERLVEALAVRLGDFAPEFVADPGQSIYRIYRDVRFSPDKSPYKTHAAAVFPHHELGKHQGAGFYVHIAPGNVFAGGGLYRPGAGDLAAVRQAIAGDPAPLRRIVSAARFRGLFGELSGEQLRRVPRGFPADHAAASLLRHRQFLAGRPFTEELASSGAFAGELQRTFRALLPLCRYLNDAILEGRRTDDPLALHSRKTHSSSSGKSS
jgi:uncharacterized protein (TIGR02453 family)